MNKESTVSLEFLARNWHIVTSSLFTLTKANHTANLNISEAGKYTPFTLVEGIAKSYGEGCKCVIPTKGRCG